MSDDTPKALTLDMLNGKMLGILGRWQSALEDRVNALDRHLEMMAARLDRLEAAVVIQTGTVFGAQGDSDRMTIEHTIPEPPLNEWKA